MGGGSSGPTQSTVYNSNLPEYARPYYEHMLGAAEQTVNQPYVAYPNQRVAGATPFMQAYYQGIGNMSPNYAALEGQDMTRMAAANAFNRSGYQPGTITSQYTPNTYTPQNLNFNTVNPGQATWSDWNGATAAQYMSPYQQYVTDQQKQSAILDYGRARNARNDNAFKANAFGGDRHGIAESLAEESLLNRLDSIQGSGLQNAFTNAQQQFNADRSTSLQGQQLNLGNDLQAQLANQSQGLNAYQLSEAARQFGTQFGDQSQQYWNNSLMNIAQQNEANRLAAQQFGLSADQLGMAGGQQMGGLGDLFQNAEMQRLSAIGQAGQLQQQQAQGALDQAYQDFVNQRDYARNNISFMSAIMHGLPTGASGQSDVISYQNPVQAALGSGISALGLQKLTSSGGTA